MVQTNACTAGRWFVGIKSSEIFVPAGSSGLPVLHAFPELLWILKPLPTLAYFLTAEEDNEWVCPLRAFGCVCVEGQGIDRHLDENVVVSHVCLFDQLSESDSVLSRQAAPF